MTQVARYRCKSCGKFSRKYLSKCPKCQSWHVFQKSFEHEALERSSPFFSVSAQEQDASFVPITQVQSSELKRILTGFGEFDKVMGGGMVGGSVLILGGAPGSGKSTLSLQACCEVAKGGRLVGYISGEESKEQARNRAGRVGAVHPNLLLMANTEVNDVITALKTRDFDVVVIDSIQSIYASDEKGSRGSVLQVKTCCAKIAHYAQQRGVCVLVIGHVTKDNALAGPRTLEHMVDAVFHLEGGRSDSFRILRSHKNRFGDISEIAVFRMLATGMEPVKETESLFLPEGGPSPGSVLSVIIEGGKAMLVEVQVLIGPEKRGAGKRNFRGIESTRINLLEAILEQEEILLQNRDFFVNIPGGMNVSQPEVDLAVATGILSSLHKRVIDPHQRLVAFGELELSGAVRRPTQSSRRIEVSQRLGYRNILSSIAETPFFVPTIADLIKLFETPWTKASTLTTTHPS